MKELKEQDLAEWLQNPVTQALQQALQRDIDEVKVAWTKGEFLRDKVNEAGMLGYVRVMQDFIDLDLEGLEGTLFPEGREARDD